MISPAFARHLRDMRMNCNRQFQEARVQFPHLDAGRFAYFLEHYADGVVNEVEQRQPRLARHVAAAVYQHGLHLTGLNWVPQLQEITGGLSGLATAWQRYIGNMLLAHNRHVNEVLVMVAHALHQFSRHGGSRPEQWLQRLHGLLAVCDSFIHWKHAGQVLAWQAGLSHYRESALALADTLPETLALYCVDAPKGGSWSEVAAGFHQSPWWTPASAPSRDIQERWRVGALAEFGGNFSTPPQVAVHDSHWYLKSGDDTWLLLADAYGATLHRLGADEAKVINFRNTPGKTVSISGQQVIVGRHAYTLHDVANVTHWAHDNTTLVVCSPDTFAAIVFSLPPQGANQA